MLKLKNKTKRTKIGGVKMIGTKMEENLRKMPMIECFVRKSKDGKYVIHKTILTHIKPIGYYEAVLKATPSEEEDEEEEEE